MNKDNLLKMADYLDAGNFGGHQFHMPKYCDCVLGHAVCVFEDGLKAHIPDIMTASRRIFGIGADDEDWLFCFGSRWSDDPHAAADRLRYVAIHGAAPSKDQWERFHEPQRGFCEPVAVTQAEGALVNA